jgi:methionyl-tRNA synthetase
MTCFISTAIPYVNARPHLGFAYELVLADILARHRRGRGDRVCFTTGTDEHSQKNVDAATREGLPTRVLVDRNAAAFAALGDLLDVQTDELIRTSLDPRHRARVESLWRACANDLYRARWSGRYCTGCEAFLDEHVALCAEHAVAPTVVTEVNWFFALSRYRDRIRDAIASNRVRIVPDSARAETLAFLSGDVRHISVSRVSTGWGISVPDDPSQVIYVWFDALANYLVPDDWQTWRERTHVIGKGITRFHAVYWLAFLLAANLPLPDHIFVHGYLTVDGAKIAKSGTTVEVPPVVERCGVDAVRWYFARQCRTRTDADVSINAILACHDRDLANRLGNLAHRCVTLLAKLPATTADDDGDALRREAIALPARIDTALDAFAVDEAAAAIIDLLDAANRHVDATAPWRLAKSDPLAARRALAPALHAARVAATELAPFVPGISRDVLRYLEVGGPPPVPTRAT